MSHPTASSVGPDTWREIARSPTIFSVQQAARNPRRGIVASNRTGDARVYVWDVPTGELRPLTDEGRTRHFALLSPDGRFAYFLDDTKGNELGHFVRVPWEGGPKEDLTPDMPLYSSSTTPFPLPIISFSASNNRVAFVYSDADGYHLCALDIAPDGALGTPKTLISGRALLRGPVLSEDGNIAVVCTNERTGKQQYDLKAMDHDGNPLATWSDGAASSVECIAFSPVPGDRRLLCTSNRSGVKRPMVWDLATGETTSLLSEGADAPAGELVPLNWSQDARYVLLSGFVNAAQCLYRFDMVEQVLTHLPHPEGAFSYFGSFGAYFSPENDACVVFSNSQTPRKALQISPNGESRVLLAASDREAPRGCEVRSVLFPSSDGVMVQAWLAVPPGEGPFPTVINVHGGPHGVATQSYGMGALWVGNGFAYLDVNFRGSTTFGRDFQQKIWGDLGHWEIEDMVAARDFLVREGVADPDRVTVTGGSYGGYLTLLALGKRPDLWAGGVAWVAIADYAMTYWDSSPLLRGITGALFQGTPDEKPAEYAAASPITYAEAVRAPILVVQGKNDTRCPARQMEIYEERMKALGKDIQLVWFDAGHGNMDDAQSIHYRQMGLDFMKRVTA